MTHQLYPSMSHDVVELLSEHGFDGMAQAIEILLDECMKIERQEFLGVGPYQRGEARNGRANGFKPKRVKTRVGELNLAVPQVRDAKFYPSALEKGCRSEKALRLALAEMRAPRAAWSARGLDGQGDQDYRRIVRLRGLFQRS